MNEATFAAEARAAQVEWKRTTKALDDEARAPGVYRGKLRSFCLPPAFAIENLLADARGALDTFARAEIPWHNSVDGGPSNHLCSSQVQCVNALAPFVCRPDALEALFGAALDLAEVIPFGDPVAPDDCVAFEWIGAGNPLGEWIDGVGTRGARNTSVDAALRYVTTDGIEEVALIEWKYTEQYVDKGELSTSKTSQATRDARYKHLYESADGPLRTDLVPYEDLFVEPVYQLFRLSLLAWQMERMGFADRVRVVYCAPAANRELWASLNRPSHREVGDGHLAELWRRMQRRPDRFVVVDTARFFERCADLRRIQEAVPAHRR